jgi:hypothetical protein
VKNTSHKTLKKKNSQINHNLSWSGKKKIKMSEEKKKKKKSGEEKKVGRQKKKKKKKKKALTVRGNPLPFP